MAQGIFVRNKIDDRAHPDGAQVQVAFGQVFVDDATGFVSSAAPAGVAIKGAPVKVARLNSMRALNAAGADLVASGAASVVTDTGALTIVNPGSYKVNVSGSVLGANSATVTVEVYKNGAVIADAANLPGGSLKAKAVMAAAAVEIGFAFSGVINGLSRGDSLDVRVSAASGTVTVKQLQFFPELLMEPASLASTQVA